MVSKTKKECSVAFGTVMAQARERRGLYQSDVASELGITQAYYSQIENGRRVIDLELAIRTCKILGIDLTEFIRSYK